MKDLKILGIVVAFALILYYGVEPFAHSQMHKHVEFKGFKYKDLKDIPKGDPKKGETLAASCAGCHSIKAAGMKAPMDAMASSAAYGVNPPDLSLAGKMLDEKFFANFLVNPAKVTKSKHFAMPPSAGSLQDAADIVAYFKEVAKKAEETTETEAKKIANEKVEKLKKSGIKVSDSQSKEIVSKTVKNAKNKEAFVFACGRCHANRYGKWTQLGDVPKTKPDINTGVDLAKIDFQKNLGAYQIKLAKYMGKLPPDLSIIVRARSEDYLKTFVEDPQTQLPGTAMPRVGLTNEGYEEVLGYLESTGDPSKEKRESTAPWVIGFFVIFTLLAYGWYKSQWKGLH